jgi:NAD+ kinase
VSTNPIPAQPWPRSRGTATPATVGLLVHPERDDPNVTLEIQAWAAALSIGLITLDSDGARFPDKVARVGEAQLGRESDLLVAVGGDGTILRALHMCAPHGTPVLGVNLGRLGFLAEVDPNDLGTALDAIARGEYAVEERLALTVTVDGATADTPEFCADAYNDAVLTRAPGLGRAALSLYVEDGLFARYLADGLVIATPTGSTAYNFSASGPIVSPRVQALMVTPVAPHSAFNRTLVVHSTEQLRVELLEQSAPVALEIDGRHRAELQPRDGLVVRASARSSRVIRLHGPNFYQRARTKLRLVDPLAISS